MCCLTLLVMFLKSLAVEKWFTQKQKEGKSSFVFSRSDIETHCTVSVCHCYRPWDCIVKFIFICSLPEF
uniref:Secreted protein n=1 Tax=Anguilla anguilla TaxID=7936 RepID=A0A0E9XSZ5_ANGAN